MFRRLLGNPAALFSITKFETDSEKRKQVNPRKVCPIDHDPTTAFVRSQKANTGQALEVSVRNELLRCGAEVAYVRTRRGYEVDFLCRGADGGEPLVQVRADPGDARTLAHEVRALKRRRWMLEAENV
jgi:predicted AAA+ superfamily ATPase